MFITKQHSAPIPAAPRKSIISAPGEHQRDLLLRSTTESSPQLSIKGLISFQISVPLLILILVNKFEEKYLDMKTPVHSLFFLLKRMNCRKCKFAIPPVWWAKKLQEPGNFFLSKVLLEHTFTLHIVHGYFLAQQSERWVAAISFKNHIICNEYYQPLYSILLPCLNSLKCAGETLPNSAIQQVTWLSH